MQDEMRAPEHATTEHKPNVDKEQAHFACFAPYSSYLITTLFELSDFYLFFLSDCYFVGGCEAASGDGLYDGYASVAVGE